MATQPISSSHVSQITSSTSIDIPGSHTENNDVTPPEVNESVCFTWVLVPLSVLLVVLLYPFYWILKKIWKYTKYYFYFLAAVFVLWLVGTLSSLTFPFLLASLLVLRFSQFIKRGEDYDKVTQVKMVVEWYMVINIVLLAFGTYIFCGVYPRIFSLKINVKIQGKSLLDWGNDISLNILAICGIRFILFWIIQKYMPRMTLEHNESELRVIQTTSDIVDCGLLWFLEVMVISYLPKHETSGFTTQHWIEVTLLVVIGWNIIALVTHLIVWSIHILVSKYLNRVYDVKERSNRYVLLERILSVKCLVYYCNGIKRSFNFMLSSLLLFLVWVLYIGSHLILINTNSKAKIVTEFGTSTCAVLLILSSLWILKDAVLLSWEANAVYNRLSSKILEAREALYFLGIIGRHSHDILKLRYDDQDDTEHGSGTRVQRFVAKNFGIVDAYYRDKRDDDDDDMTEHTTEGNSTQLKPKLSNKKRSRVKHDLLKVKDDTMTLFNIQQVAQYFLTAASALSKETYTSDILRKLTPIEHRSILEKLITGKNNVSDVIHSSSESVLQDWQNFQSLLDFDTSIYISHSQLKTWVERSHHKCLFLANTLCSTKDVVDCLNNIISVVLICASFILWLLFTGLADTKALVLIASPLLAATFIFGDTCKNLFQGIIFVYVVHPFDVGDLCVIDEKMMEVKSIGVWKTTFSMVEKVVTFEEVIYPNSELAMKMFINHKTEFDWNDFVELDVDHLDKPQVKELKTQIEKLLVAKEDESMPGSHSVLVISTGKDVKIAVRFRHNVRSADMTYFECVKTKDELRSEFLLNVQNLADTKEDHN